MLLIFISFFFSFFVILDFFLEKVFAFKVIFLLFNLINTS